MKNLLTKIKKRINTSFVVVFIGIILTIIVIIKLKKNSNKNDNVFFQSFNESFAGKVIKIKTYNIINDSIQTGGGTKFNAIYLKLQKSKTSQYDFLDTAFSNYCLIKKSSAIVFEATYQSKNIEIGDILYFNGIIDSMHHYKIFNRDSVFKINRQQIYAKKNVPLLINVWRPEHIINQNRKRLIESIDDF